MTRVSFHDRVSDASLCYAVVVSRSAGKWVFCKHCMRDTLESPGGRREDGEPILETARRELFEETGALEYVMSCVCAYEVARDVGESSFGMLYYADITAFEPVLMHEIEKTVLLDGLPSNWTYPDIQPMLIDEIQRRGFVFETI